MGEVTTLIGGERASELGRVKPGYSVYRERLDGEICGHASYYGRATKSTCDLYELLSLEVICVANFSKWLKPIMKSANWLCSRMDIFDF
jgi:hypothetical protein